MTLLGATLNSLKMAARPVARSAVIPHRTFHSSLRAPAIYSKANAETADKVIQASRDRIVLVDFYADWCQPCRLFSPILEKFAAEPHDSANGLPVDLVKVDIESDQGRPLAMERQITSLPTVYVYKNCEVVQRLEGALPERRLKELLDNL